MSGGMSGGMSGVMSKATRIETWRERLLTIATVTATTALVWVWASSQTRQSADVTCEIHFVPATPESQIVEPTEPITLRIQFTGSKIAVDRAIDAMNGRTIDVPVGTAGVPNESGAHKVMLADMLAQLPVVSESGAAVHSVQPSSAGLAVETLVTREARVTARFGNARAGGEVAIEPSTVRVMIPSQQLAGIPDQLVVDAIVPADTLAQLEPGRRHQVEALLTLPPDVAAIAGRARITPAKARVAFTLDSAERALTIKQVPVQISASPTQLASHAVRLAQSDEYLANVMLAGPEPLLRAIERGEIKSMVAAIVTLGDADFEQTSVRKPIALWSLPPGVRVVSVGGLTAIPTVQVEITAK